MTKESDESPGSQRNLQKLEFDTVRPAAGDSQDAYSAETVVKAIPKEFLAELSAALKPAKVPDIAGAPAPAPKPEAAEPAPPPEPVEPPASNDGLFWAIGGILAIAVGIAILFFA